MGESTGTIYKLRTSVRLLLRIFLTIAVVAWLAVLSGCGGSGGSGGGLAGTGSSISGLVVLPAGVNLQQRAAAGDDSTRIEVWLEQRPEIRAFCDAQGRYILSNVPVDVSLNVIARWQEPGNGRTFIQRSVAFVVAPGMNQEIADTGLELATRRLVVMVRDLFGNPVAAAQFSVWGIQGQTDLQGRLITPAVPGSVNSIVLTVLAGGFTPFIVELPVFSNDLGPLIEVNLATQQDARRTPVISFQPLVTSVGPSTTSTLAVVVIDPDRLLPAGYQINWSATHGNLTPAADKKTAVWQAPAENGLATISVSIAVAEFKSGASVGITVGGSYQVNARVVSFAPLSGAAGETVTIKGYGLGEASANNRVLFAGAPGQVLEWSPEEIKVVIPVDAESGPLTLDKAGNTVAAGNFTVIDYATVLSPLFGPPETVVTVTGYGFGDEQGESRVTLRGDVLPVLKWTNTEIQAKVLLSSHSGSLAVTIRGRLRPVADYVVTRVNAINPIWVTRLTDGSASQVKISGTGFGEEQGESTVMFHDGQEGTVVSWSDSEIEAEVPFAARSGDLVLTISGATVLTPRLNIVYHDVYTADVSWSGPIFDSKPFLPGIAIAGSGDYLLTDFSNGWLWKFTAAGDFVERIGSPGPGNGQFVQPWGIAVDGAGNIFVADAPSPGGMAGDRIQKLDASGNFVATIGGGGAAPGQFNLPQGIAIDSAGNVYVADSGNDRIQKFTNQLVFVSEFGSTGIGDGEFDSPAGVAVSPDGKLYVADRKNHRIEEFAANGTFLRWYGLDELGNTGWKASGSGRSGRSGAGAGQFDEPYGLLVSAAGDLLVADSENGRIQKINRVTGAAEIIGGQGRGDGQFMGPIGLALDGSDLLIADSENSRIQVVSIAGVFAKKIVPDTSELNTSFTCVSVDRSNGLIFALDRADDSIAVYDLFGGFKQRIGSSGSGNGQLLDPRGLAVDADGNLLVADTGNARIVKLSPAGEQLMSFGAFGSGPGQFKSPERVAVDSGGRILVSDFDADQVLVFEAAGNFLFSFGGSGNGNGKFNGPLGVAAAPDDSIYVADSGNARVQKFSAAGSFIGWFGADETGNADWHEADTSNRGVIGAGPCRFNYPADLAVDLEGCVYVLDFTAQQIQKFGPDHASEDLAHYVTKMDSASGFVGLAVDESGNLFTTDQNQQITRFLPSLSY